MTAEVQPDLFGEFDAAEQERSDADAARVEWAARFERRPFPAPYDSSSYRKGDTVNGWVCPACGDVEWGEFQLDLNHGYDPNTVDRLPGHWAGAQFGETCQRLMTHERLRDLDRREGTPGLRIAVAASLVSPVTPSTRESTE